LPREKAPLTHWIGGWVGPRAILDAVVKKKIPCPAWSACIIYKFQYRVMCIVLEVEY